MKENRTILPLTHIIPILFSTLKLKQTLQKKLYGNNFLPIEVL